MDNYDRLSDYILTALKFSIEQEDVQIAEILNNALDLSLTRNSGGGEFVERRDYPTEVEKAMTALRKHKA